MAIRVVARIRPKQLSELGKDAILSTVSKTEASDQQPTLVKIPNPKNEAEDFTFQFSSVYDHTATQQQIFDNEGQQGRRQWHSGVMLICDSGAYGKTPIQWI